MSIGDLAVPDRPLVVPMPWDDYERLDPDTRHEYISGNLVVNPRPTLQHQVVVHNLTAALRAACPPGYLAVSEWAWKPGADEWAPDVMVCRPGEETVRFTGTPELIVEVLSTNRADDLVRKLYRYTAAGLPRYWVADPIEPSVRAYLLRDGAYEEVGRAIADDQVEFDFGAGKVTLQPTRLLH